MNNHDSFPQLLSSSFISVDIILCIKRIHASLKSIILHNKHWRQDGLCSPKCMDWSLKCNADSPPPHRKAMGLFGTNRISDLPRKQQRFCELQVVPQKRSHKPLSSQSLRIQNLAHAWVLKSPVFFQPKAHLAHSWNHKRFGFFFPFHET